MSFVLLLLVLPFAGSLNAQGSVAAIGQTVPPAVAANAQESAAESNSSAPAIEDGQIARRDALLGLSAWDHTLRGAFELGARLILISREAASPADANAILPQRTIALRFSSSGSPTSLASMVNAFRLDQLARNGMNVGLNSALGSFRVTYREIFSGRPNSLGGGVGQASAAATYTTPRFGGKGVMDFSAAALMGTGSINTLMGSGFGNSAIGGNGPGRKPQDAPTVAIKLTF
ncbi:MAG: hypothetical protein WBE76_02910 [Terracidiphilus sp.]